MPHKEERKFSCICFGYLTCYEEGVGSTAYWQHKGAHALLGCAVGAAKAGDCQSGAAGVIYGIDAGVEKWGGGSDFAQTYTGSYSQKIINTTANTAVHSLAEGKTLREFGYSLEDAYKTLAIDTAAEKGAKFIGENFAGGSLKEGVGSTAYWQHKGAHALLGCAVGAAKAGDCAIWSSRSSYRRNNSRNSRQIFNKRWRI